MAAGLRRGDIVGLDVHGDRAVSKVKPRLHVKSGGSEGIVVEIGDRLFNEGVEIGDIVRVDEGLQFAFEKLPNYETGGLAIEEVPDVTYDDIGGLDSQIEEIRDAIELPYIHRTLFDEYRLGRPRGILLHGPPGCGKTMIAKAIANSLTQGIRNHLASMARRLRLFQSFEKEPENGKHFEQCCQFVNSECRMPEGNDSSGQMDRDEVSRLMKEHFRLNDIDLEDTESELSRIEGTLQSENGIRSFFLNVKGPELLNKYVGETEHRIRKIFEEAKRRATFFTPVVIFFDEMEAMFRACGSGRSSDVETTIVPQFLAEMDGVESSENVIVVGASNRHEMIDPAVLRPGRLDAKVKIDRPEREACMMIMALYLTPDLALLPDGLERMAEQSAQAVAFKNSVARCTARLLGRSLSAEDLDRLVRFVPDGCDFRKAVAQNPDFLKNNGNRRIAELIEHAAGRERLAETMIREIVSLLFEPACQLEAVTGTGKRYVFPIRDFVSGALLSSIVSRGKKKAVKRQIMVPGDPSRGISAADLKAAIKDEFEESAEQFAYDRLEYQLGPKEPGQPRDVVRMAEVQLGRHEESPWNLEKEKPYRY